MMPRVQRGLADPAPSRRSSAAHVTSSRRRTEPAGRSSARALIRLLPACAVALVGCGPSFQSIYEGNVRFEHCYRLDLDLAIAPSHRQTCWRQWLKSYTYGQARDRIEYARRRVRAFAAGDVSRPRLELGSKARSEERQFYLLVPSPTSPHAPPPPIATPVQTEPSAVPAPAVPSAPPPAPGASCATGCSSAWQSCQAACGPGGGVSEMACKSCEPDYKKCMKRCFD